MIGNKYYYVVVSTNGDGFTSTSSEQSFVTPSLKDRKDADESVSNSTTLHDDNDLSLGLEANKTYTIDGYIVAQSANQNPDIKIAFVASESTVDVGYIATSGSTVRKAEFLDGSGTVSSSIPLPANEPVIIQITGTVVAGSSGETFVLQWAQNSSHSIATQVLEGSYLRAEEI